VILRQFEQDATTTSRLSLTVARDTRNDAILATSGHEISATGMVAGLGGFTKFLRFETRGSFYTQVPGWIPLPRRERSSMQLSAGIGWTEPFNSLSDFDLKGPDQCQNGEVCPLSLIDEDLKLPLTDRYFMGGVGALQLRGFKARSVGPRRSELYETNPGGYNPNLPQGLYTTTDRDQYGQCVSSNGKCNSINDKKIGDFEDLNDAEVIGGSKFLSFSAEYRFPVSEALGLVGILFFDGGNAFAEDENMFRPDDWRFGTGIGALWFSPFGPLQVFWGVPLDPLEDEKSSVFEFNVGGR
jgi:outer membrane protein assembly factor BamA